jgi:hypothetical protein
LLFHHQVFGGLKSGIGGLFSAPVKGAQKEGVGGFFKGVGKGLAGVVVKPIVGVAEGVTAVVQSVSNSTDLKAVSVDPLRSRRAIPLLPTSSSTSSDGGGLARMILVSYDDDAALAQSLVLGSSSLDSSSSSSGGGGGEGGGLSSSSFSSFGRHDLYVGHVSLPHPSDPRLRVLVVVSLRRLLLRVETDPIVREQERQQRKQKRLGLDLDFERLNHHFKPVTVGVAWGQVVQCLPQPSPLITGAAAAAAAAAGGGGGGEGGGVGGGGGGVLVCLYAKEPRMSSILGLETSEGDTKLFLSCGPNDKNTTSANLTKLYGLLCTRKSAMGDARNMPESATTFTIGENSSSSSISAGGGGGGVGGSSAAAGSATTTVRPTTTYSFGTSQKEALAALGSAAEQVSPTEAQMSEMAILEVSRHNNVMVVVTISSINYLSGRGPFLNPTPVALID